MKHFKPIEGISFSRFFLGAPGKGGKVLRKNMLKLLLLFNAIRYRIQTQDIVI